MTLLMKILTEILVEGSGLATGTSNDWGLPRGCFWLASVLGTGNAHIVFFSWLPGMFVPSCHPSRIISYQGQIIPPSKAVLTAWSWICSISGASPGHLFSANLRAPIGHVLLALLYLKRGPGSLGHRWSLSLAPLQAAGSPGPPTHLQIFYH